MTQAVKQPSDRQMTLEEQTRAFCAAWQSLDGVYESYARSVGVPYTTLYVIMLISRQQGLTQKDIREASFLPKQTVNSVVTALYKKGLVELRERPDDRRAKAIYLTAEGRAYADGLIPRVHEAETAAMGSLPPDLRSGLLKGIEAYNLAFRAAILRE